MATEYQEIRRPANEPVTADYGFMAKPGDHADVGWVIFAGDSNEKYIKIGYGKDLRNRFADYTSGRIFGPSGVCFLAAIRGTEDDENTLHKHFKRCWAQEFKPKREFFAADPALVEYIAWLRQHYWVARSIRDAYSGSRYSDLGQTVVRPDDWLPILGDSRRTTDRLPADLLTDSQPWGWMPGRRVDVLSDEYFTPPELLDPARVALGGFDLDPASQFEANIRIKAKRFYTRETNGLAKPWFGRVWLNPPFSKWPDFSVKAVEELDRGDITGMIVLANSRAVTAKYFAPLLRQSVGLCVLTGRYQFDGLLEYDGSPSNGQVIVLVRGDFTAFSDAYREIGVSFRGDL